MDTPGAGPQASTRNNANRRPSFKFTSAQSIATLDQRLTQLEARRASTGRQGRGATPTRSTAAIALDADLDHAEDRWSDVQAFASKLEKSSNRTQDRISFMENVQHTTEDRLRKLESASGSASSVQGPIAEQLRSRDERILRLEEDLHARDERMKRLEDTIQPYKLYLDKAKEADQKLNVSMAQIKTYLNLKRRNESASPFVNAQTNANHAPPKAQEEPAKAATREESIQDVAGTLIAMLSKGASLDGEILIALNAALAQSARAAPRPDLEQPSSDTPHEPPRAESYESQDDVRPWEAPIKPSSTHQTRANRNGIAQQDVAQATNHQTLLPDTNGNGIPYKSAMKSRKRSPNGDDTQEDTPRKRVRISQPSTPIADPVYGPLDDDILGVVEDGDGTPEIRRTPRATQRRAQPPDMVNWKDASDSLRGMRPR